MWVQVLSVRAVGEAKTCACTCRSSASRRAREGTRRKWGRWGISVEEWGDQAWLRRGGRCVEQKASSMAAWPLLPLPAGSEKAHPGATVSYAPALPAWSRAVHFALAYRYLPQVCSLPLFLFHYHLQLQAKRSTVASEQGPEITEARAAGPGDSAEVIMPQHFLQDRFEEGGGSCYSLQGSWKAICANSWG